MPYASWTGTKRNLRALRLAGWRLLMSPDTMKASRRGPPRWADGSPAPYALDNGAWGAHQRGAPFDAAAFEDALGVLGTRADWIVAPDVVSGGLFSLSVTRAWLPRLSGFRLILIAVQDGMEPADVAALLGPRVGLFLGGSTGWKLSTLNLWGRLARDVGCHYHIGRVNTVNRIMRCEDAGADSFDGTSATRFAVNITRLDHARRQLNLYTEK